MIKRIWTDAVASKIIATFATDALKWCVPLLFAATVPWIGSKLRWWSVAHPWLVALIIDLSTIAVMLAVYFFLKRRRLARSETFDLPPETAAKASVTPAKELASSASASAPGHQSPAVAFHTVGAGATVHQEFNYTEQSESRAKADKISEVYAKFHELLKFACDGSDVKLALSEADNTRVRYQYLLDSELNEHLKNLQLKVFTTNAQDRTLKNPNWRAAVEPAERIAKFQEIQAAESEIREELETGLSARFQNILQSSHAAETARRNSDPAKEVEPVMVFELVSDRRSLAGPPLVHTPTVHNIGKESAFSVQVQPITSGQFVIAFDPISMLTAGSKAKLRFSITEDGEKNGFSGSIDRLGNLLQTRRLGMETHVTVCYKDRTSRSYRSTHTVKVHDVTLEVATTFGDAQAQ